MLEKETGKLAVITIFKMDRDQQKDIGYAYKMLILLWEKEEKEQKEAQREISEKYLKLTEPYLKKLKELEPIKS